jgi:hypothetical protein
MTYRRFDSPSSTKYCRASLSAASIAHEKHMTDAFRRARDQLVGQLFRRFRREKAGMRISETIELFAHRGEHVRMRMPQAGHRRPARGIDILPACAVADDDAASLRGNRIGVTGLAMKDVRHDIAVYTNSRRSSAALTRSCSCLARRAGACLDPAARGAFGTKDKEHTWDGLAYRHRYWWDLHGRGPGR